MGHMVQKHAYHDASKNERVGNAPTSHSEQTYTNMFTYTCLLSEPEVVPRVETYLLTLVGKGFN